MNPRSLSSHQRSPFARRVLAYIRAQDPLISEGEVARRVGVSGQAFSNWMLSKNEPKGKHIKKLAEVLGCTEEEIRRDIEASRNWVPPIVFDEFVGEAIIAAEKEHWEFGPGITKYLRLGRAEMWRDQDSVWAVMTRDILSLPLPLQEKATRIAHLVRAWERYRNDPDLY